MVTPLGVGPAQVHASRSPFLGCLLQPLAIGEMLAVFSYPMRYFCIPYS